MAETYSHHFVILALFAIVLFQLTVTAASEDKRNGEKYPETLILLGEVDGKFIYVETTPMNWNDSLAFCENLGMRLLSITSAAQIAFLQSVANPDYFLGSHWLAGRDSLQLRQVSWHYTNEELDSAILLLGHTRGTEKYTCVSAHFYNEWSGSVGFDRCTTLYPLVCEK